MKSIVILCLILLASDCDPASNQYSSQYVVRICSPDNINDLIDYSNQWLSATDVRFIRSTSACDATVEIKTPRKAGAAGAAYVLVGEIELSQHSDIRVSFMHEILHCAGIGHEPNDRTSVMFTHASRDPAETRQLHPHHLNALRRLAGISPIGRIRSQIEVLD